MKYISRNIIIRYINTYIIDSPTTINISYIWNIGSLLGIQLIIQVISGICIALYYTPDIPFSSIQLIYRDIWYGSIIRYVHINGASIYFILVYIHIGKALYYGSYIKPRIGIWIIGIIIYIIMMCTAFLGYTLPFGSMSYWGATVITSMLSAIPFIGDILVIYIWGSYSITKYTIYRFYVLHFILPFILLGIILIHIIYLHRSGSNNPLGINTNVDKVPFNPYYIFKDIYGIIFIMSIYIIMITYIPLYNSDNTNYIEADRFITPLNIYPEYYFLGYYAILRSIPNKLLGVITMFIAIFILIYIPYNHSIIRSNIYIPISRIIYWIYVSNYILLTYIGGNQPSNINVYYTRICTIIYFLYYLY